MHVSQVSRTDPRGARESGLTLGSVDEVGGDVTTVKLHSLDDLQLIVQRLPILTRKARKDQRYNTTMLLIGWWLHQHLTNRTLTVMTPLRPTFFMALEITLPISTSPLAEIVATWKTEDAVKPSTYKPGR